MLNDVTISLDLNQLLGGDIDTRRTRVYVKTNVANGTLIDTSTGETRLGDERVTLEADGTGSFTTWGVGADGNPTSWQTSVVVEYPRAGSRDRATRTFGPYTITDADDGKNLAELEDEQAIPPNYQSAFTADMETIRDEAEAARDAAVDISNIDVPDDVVSTLIEGTAGAGPLTRAALSASYVAPRAKGVGVDQVGSLPEFRVEDFGAVCDGVTNDSAAVKAARDAAVEEGGGIILVPDGGTVRLATSYVPTDPTYSFFQHAIDLAGDNLVLAGHGPGSRVLIDGPAYGARVWWQQDHGTIYTMTPANRGDQGITLATPADAANFAPGDHVLIQTGNTVGADDTPDSEQNVVVSANATTGEIVMVKPIAKNYRQENYISGSSGVTAIGGAGVAAPFGVKKVYPSINPGIRDLVIDHRGLSAAVAGQGVVGLRLEGIEAECARSFQSISAHSDSRIIGNRIHVTDTSPTSTGYWFSTAWGCRDVEIAGNICSARTVRQLHIHEGSSFVRAHHNVFAVPPLVASINPVVSVTARGYSITIDHNQFINSGTDRLGLVNADVLYSMVDHNTATIRQGNGWRFVATDLVHDSNPVVGYTKFGTHGPNQPGDSVTITGREFVAPAANAATLATDTASSSFPVAKFSDAAAIRTALTYARIPDHWVSYVVELRWVGPATGNVLWQVDIVDITDGNTLTATSEQSKATTHAAVGSNQVQTSTMEPTVPDGFAVNGRTLRLAVSRLGSNAADTMVGDAELISVRLVPKYRSR